MRPVPPPAALRGEPLTQSGVRAEVALLRGEVRAVAGQVSGLAEELRRQGKTDWPALLTAGGLAVSVAVGLGALALDPLRAAADDARVAAAAVRTELHGVHRELAARSAKSAAAHAAAGHPAAAARLADAERRLGRLEESR